LGVTLRVLKEKGLLDRFELYEESPRCQGEFEQKVEAFYEKISKLPKDAKAEAEQ
jgi:hypothetical protein